MQRAFGARSAWFASVLGLAWVGLSMGAAPAQAIEFFDERLQIHGFYETRMSFGYEDFNAGNGIDMYGWLHVLNIEAEAEIAPDGWGPFDMVAAFARVEVKYDCVWHHACGTLKSVDTFGNNPGNLPNRVQQGKRSGLAGSQKIIDDRRPYWFADRQRLSGGLYADVLPGQRAAKQFAYGSTLVGLFGASAGPDGQLGDFQNVRNEQGLPGAFEYATGFTDPTTLLPGDDDAGVYLFNRTSRCKVGNTRSKASNQVGESSRELIWAIDDCRIDPLGFNREIANPFADQATSPFFAVGSTTLHGDINPVLRSINQDPTSPNFGLPLDPNGIPDASALPFRPGPEFAALPHNKVDHAGGQPSWASQGIFVPNLAVRRAIRRNDFDSYDQNYSLNELQWNRGASQEPLKELRELYMEFEAFESQLWVRAGKQTIVWGKTELFRNQDQWNPVDIAIGPLSSLEESRIALWAVRGIWSFYEVGPLEDVRLELVGLFDKFEPTDIGRCGEPFVPKLACAKTYGLWIHGQNGTGVAGEIRPDDPWENVSGTEVGARLEFRWDRFSFAISDYWGYADTPYQSLLFQYSRNVDPIYGRPRHTDTTGTCQFGTEPACLVPGMDPNPNDPTDNGVIANHSINQSLFAWICAGTVGVAPTVDAAACAFTLFNSKNPINATLGVPFSSVFSNIIAGTPSGTTFLGLIAGDVPGQPPIVGNALQAAYGPAGTNTLSYRGAPFTPAFAPTPSPLVPLVNATIGNNGVGLDGALSPEQRALFGCGPFYNTTCNAVEADGRTPTADLGGVDLGNTEASAVLQSFTWFEGTYFNSSWDTADASLPQPGTVDSLVNDGAGGGVDAPFSKPGELETGSVAMRYEDDGNGNDDDGDGSLKDIWILPGARYERSLLDPIITNLQNQGIEVPAYLMAHYNQYDAAVDGTTTVAPPGGVAAPAIHPFTGQLWASKMAMASWNLMMLAATLGAADDAVSLGTMDRNQPLALGRCSFRQPQYCTFVSGFASQARVTSQSVRAGGNGRFGRRNFVWHSVGDLALRYQKRNILGFSTDFAEDTTKSSWGIEFTWVDDSLTADNTQYDGLSKVDEYNLTLSVDRPTFVNFLNPNRTFLLNTQLFISYLDGYNVGMLREGPWTFLWLVNASTGYFQDRFLVSAVMVFDLKSNSRAFLPTVQYRLTENFSITVGLNAFSGGFSKRRMGINQFAAFDEDNLESRIYVENGISPVRDLDGFFARIRYTF